MVHSESLDLPSGKNLCFFLCMEMIFGLLNVDVKVAAT